MVFEKGSRNSVLKAANTICSNKQIGVQEQLSDDIQPYFPLKHQLLTAEKSMALKAARIKLMGNATHFSQLPSLIRFIYHPQPQLFQLQPCSSPPRLCKQD